LVHARIWRTAARRAPEAGTHLGYDASRAEHAGALRGEARERALLALRLTVPDVDGTELATHSIPLDP